MQYQDFKAIILQYFLQLFFCNSAFSFSSFYKELLKCLVKFIYTTLILFLSCLQVWLRFLAIAWVREVSSGNVEDNVTATPEHWYGTQRMQMSFSVLADLTYNLKKTHHIYAIPYFISVKKNKNNKKI